MHSCITTACFGFSLPTRTGDQRSATQMKKAIQKVAALVLASTALSACSTFFPNTDATPDPKSEERYAQLMRTLQEARAEQGKGRSFHASTPPWIVGSEVVELARYPELEDKWITIGEFNKTLAAIAPRLTKLAGIAFTLLRISIRLIQKIPLAGVVQAKRPRTPQAVAPSAFSRTVLLVE